MEYREFMGARPSLLGYGCMRFEVKEGHVDVPAAEALIDRAYAAGVRYFDTAYRYLGGESEPVAGKALSKYPREEYCLATKLPNWMVNSREDAERIFADQLERCGVEYFDFYLMHALSATSWARMEEFGIYDLLAQYKAEGKIRRLGFSFHDSAAVLETICAAHPWDFAQIQLNYFDWDYQDAKGQYETLRRHGLGVVIMEPVRGGMLADLHADANAVLTEAAPGRSVASWAIRYAASLPGVVTVLSGMNTQAQVDDNVAATSPFVPLSDAERAALDRALAVFKQAVTVPCTACRYCVEGCPQSILIPENIAAINEITFSRDRDTFVKKIAEAGAAASECIRCGACEAICPQHIGIPDVLAEVAKLSAQFAK